VLAVATGNLVAAAISAAFGGWLLARRAKWASDVYALESLGRFGPPVVAGVALLLLVAAAWLCVDAFS
jgi:ABC-type molybdate transport system permease subunit